MNGNSYLLDTNAVIGLLKGNDFLENTLENADWVGISVISIIEFFSFSQLSNNDKILFRTFLDRVEIINMPAEPRLLEVIGSFKIVNGLKLPDAVIAACADEKKLVLVTNDADFKKVKDLKLLTF